jgi:excisionase family DNA binding protein
MDTHRTSRLSSLVTISDAAADLRLCRRTIEYLIARGRLRSVRIGRSIRIPREEIARLAREGA